MPHWRVCAETIRDLDIETQRSAYLLYQAGRYMRVRALYEEAETLLRLSIEIAERVHGAIHETTAEYLDALACLYRELDRCNDAEPLHERAVQICETVFGPEHPQTAAKLHNMACSIRSGKSIPGPKRSSGACWQYAKRRSRQTFG